MERSQRSREMIFLVVTVVVLAAAVGLFLYARRLPGRPQQAQAKAADESASAPARASQPKPPRSGRDPFAARRQDEQGAAPKPDVRQMKLVGIVQGQDRAPIAVIRVGRERYYVALGQQAAGYTVLSIGEDRAVLDGDHATITLLLRAPGQAATGR